MKKRNKLISTFLLVPIILLNAPLGMAASCSMNAVAQKPMSCCTVEAPSEWLPQYHLQKTDCGCQIKQSSVPAIPIVNSLEVQYKNIKVSEKQFVSTSIKILSNFTNLTPSHFNFEFFYHPKFPAELKIYDLVASYLI